MANKFVRQARGQQKEVIPMLLDIQHFYGEHEGRIGPLIMTLLIVCLPILLYVYFGLFNYIPIPFLIVVEIIVIVRALLIIQGREGYRLKMYRRSLYDDYIGTAQLMNIRAIHNGTAAQGTMDQSGLVEFTNGTVAYFVLAYNGTVRNDDQHAKSVKRLIETMVGEQPFDVHILNDNQVSNLYEYYKKIKHFAKNEAATNFVKIIDYCREQTQSSSMVQAICYVIKGHKGDWKDMYMNIHTAINSNDAKAYKSIKLLTTDEELSTVINRDADTVVSINELLRRKYKTGEYGDSQVLKFDVDKQDMLYLGNRPEETLLPKTPAHTFHVKYEDEDD